MEIEQLQRKLLEAQTMLDQKRKDGASINEILAAYEAIHQAERTLAAAQEQEYAVELHLGIVPEASISGAHLFQDESHHFLAFNSMRPRPDGGLRQPSGLAIVELIGCLITRFGHPNDEALPGHSLFHRGLEGYGIYEVHNSMWCDEVVKINRVRFPATNRSYCGRHFMFTFHDDTLECLASDLKLEVKPYSPRFEKVYEVIRAWWSIQEVLRPREP